MNRNPLEICYLIHCIKDYYGALRELVPAYSREDIRDFVKLGINNLYHEIYHRYIHRDSDQIHELLPFAYKGVFFILQNLHYLRSGVFIGTKRELLTRLNGKDHAVLECAMELSRGSEFDFQECFELLFYWCQDTLQSL